MCWGLGVTPRVKKVQFTCSDATRKKKDDPGRKGSLSASRNISALRDFLEC